MFYCSILSLLQIRILVCSLLICCFILHLRELYFYLLLFYYDYLRFYELFYDSSLLSFLGSSLSLVSLGDTFYPHRPPTSLKSFVVSCVPFRFPAILLAPTSFHITPQLPISLPALPPPRFFSRSFPNPTNTILHPPKIYLISILFYCIKFIYSSIYYSYCN